MLWAHTALLSGGDGQTRVADHAGSRDVWGLVPEMEHELRLGRSLYVWTGTRSYIDVEKLSQ